MLNCSEIKEFINNSAHSFFKCEQSGGFLSITTPFSYPDGDDIELFLDNRNGDLILSDMGETLRYLDTYLLDVTSTKKKKSIIQDVIKSNNLLFNQGSIYAIIKNQQRILDAIFNMSQAIIRITDLLYTMKGQSLAAFEEEFKSFLDEYHFNYEEDFIVETPSHQYVFDFAVENRNSVGLVKLLNAPKKPSQKPNISRIVQAWYDISINDPIKYPQNNRITILDDTIYPWSQNDYQLIESLSTVNFWSKKDQIIKTLKNIA
mgnify:FL=1